MAAFLPRYPQAQVLSEIYSEESRESHPSTRQRHTVRFILICYWVFFRFRWGVGGWVRVFRGETKPKTRLHQLPPNPSTLLRQYNANDVRHSSGIFIKLFYALCRFVVVRCYFFLLKQLRQIALLWTEEHPRGGWRHAHVMCKAHSANIRSDPIWRLSKVNSTLRHSTALHSTPLHSIPLHSSKLNLTLGAVVKVHFK